MTPDQTAFNLETILVFKNAENCPENISNEQQFTIWKKKKQNLREIAGGAQEDETESREVREIGPAHFRCLTERPRAFLRHHNLLVVVVVIVIIVIITSDRTAKSPPAT